MDRPSAGWRTRRRPVAGQREDRHRGDHGRRNDDDGPDEQPPVPAGAAGLLGLQGFGGDVVGLPDAVEETADGHLVRVGKFGPGFGNVLGDLVDELPPTGGGEGPQGGIEALEVLRDDPVLLLCIHGHRVRPPSSTRSTAVRNRRHWTMKASSARRPSGSGGSSGGVGPGATPARRSRPFRPGGAGPGAGRRSPRWSPGRRPRPEPRVSSKPVAVGVSQQRQHAVLDGAPPHLGQQLACATSYHAAHGS